MRGAWIEINKHLAVVAPTRRSLPMREAWIEICVAGGILSLHVEVAPHAGSVD